MSNRRSTLAGLTFLFTATVVSPLSAQSAGKPARRLFFTVTPAISTPIKIPDLVVIKASVRTPPPNWAVMERRLIETMDEAAPFYLKRFTRMGGEIVGRGKVDDFYEMFYNWPLFYAIGGDRKVLDWALLEWNSITRQFTYERPELYKEFWAQQDWFHMTEGSMAFYDFGVADPTIVENVLRAKLFAGFYLDEDPEAPNYDPVHRVVRSPFTGSKGPRFRVDREGEAIYRVDPAYGWSSLYPVLKHLGPDWAGSPKAKAQIQDLYEKIILHGDIPLNLSITALVANAYLYTGEEKYKNWVLEYVNAWMQKIRENDGIIPDNVGPTGIVGENREGQWWGGFFGWTSRYSVHMIYGALTVAAECAQLVSGDSRYLDLLRSQIDMLMSHAITRGGQLLVPYKHGIDGWSDFRPMMIRDLAHLWHASMEPRDWEKIERLRAGSKYGPLPYSDEFFDPMRNAAVVSGRSSVPGEVLKPEGWEPDGTMIDWNAVASIEDRDVNTRNEFPRLQYYAGRNPDWPERILEAEYEEVARKMDFMRQDQRDLSSVILADWYQCNPILTKGLTQVTMGAPRSVYNGGLLRARVRYFDMDRARPGLPPDVAALVEQLETDRTVVQLVNLSVVEPRDVIVQAGAFGEHEFTEVRFQQQWTNAAGNEALKERTVPVHKKFFAVQLPPGVGIRLDIGTRRFVNRPTYAFPWHNDSVPLQTLPPTILKYPTPHPSGDK